MTARVAPTVLCFPVRPPKWAALELLLNCIHISLGENIVWGPPEEAVHSAVYLYFMYFVTETVDQEVA